MIPATGASLDTLLILARKARARVRRYESLRGSGQNSQADPMLPGMFDLRRELRACYLACIKAADPEDQPDAELMDQVQFLLRALAPGIRRPASTRQFQSVARRRRQKVTEETDTVVTEKKSSGTRTRRKRPAPR